MHITAHHARTYLLRHITIPHTRPPAIYAGIVTESCFRLSELSRAIDAAFPR
jgi:hypothetical protein